MEKQEESRYETCISAERQQMYRKKKTYQSEITISRERDSSAGNVILRFTEAVGLKTEYRSVLRQRKGPEGV